MTRVFCSFWSLIAGEINFFWDTSTFSTNLGALVTCLTCCSWWVIKTGVWTCVIFCSTNLMTGADGTKTCWLINGSEIFFCCVWITCWISSSLGKVVCFCTTCWSSGCEIWITSFWKSPNSRLYLIFRQHLRKTSPFGWVSRTYLLRSQRLGKFASQIDLVSSHVMPFKWRTFSSFLLKSHRCLQSQIKGLSSTSIS